MLSILLSSNGNNPNTAGLNLNKPSLVALSGNGMNPVIDSVGASSHDCSTPVEEHMRVVSPSKGGVALGSMYQYKDHKDGVFDR